MPLDSFDAVQHMLECLPDDVDEAFIEKQEMQTQLVLEAVNVKLSARVMRSYSAFVHGMSQVQQLKSDLTLTAIQCRSARKHLSRIRTETVEPGLTILAKVRRKRALGELLKLTHGVRSLHHDSLEVHARLRSVTNVAESPPPPPGTDVDSAHAPSAAASVSLPFDMLRCAELQRSCERRAAQLSRLKPVKRMEARISSAAEALQVKGCCQPMRAEGDVSLAGIRGERFMAITFEHTWAEGWNICTYGRPHKRPNNRSMRACLGERRRLTGRGIFFSSLPPRILRASYSRLLTLAILTLRASYSPRNGAASLSSQYAAHFSLDPMVFQDAMHLELRRVSSDFDEGAYASAINCALILDRVDELVNRKPLASGRSIDLSPHTAGLICEVGTTQLLDRLPSLHAYLSLV